MGKINKQKARTFIKADGPLDERVIKELLRALSSVLSKDSSLIGVDSEFDKTLSGIMEHMRNKGAFVMTKEIPVAAEMSGIDSDCLYTVKLMLTKEKWERPTSGK